MNILHRVVRSRQCLGSNLWQSGELINPFGLTHGGVPDLQATRRSDVRSSVLRQATQALLAGQSHPIGAHYAQLNNNAIERSAIARHRKL